MGRFFRISVFSALAVSCSAVFGQSGAGDANSMARLNARISELQQQIVEMQKKHDEEMAMLKKQINNLASQAEKQETKDELASLRELAQAEAAKEKPTEEKAEAVTFKSGGLSLQSLNPEISFAGDFLFSSRQDSTSEESSDFDFRVLDIHVESWLDPYTRS